MSDPVFQAAREALQTVARGDDPAAERASLTGGALTFESFAKAYIQRYAKRKKRSWAADARMIEGDLLPAWRRRPADAITRRDVIEAILRHLGLWPPPRRVPRIVLPQPPPEAPKPRADPGPPEALDESERSQVPAWWDDDDAFCQVPRWDP